MNLEHIIAKRPTKTIYRDGDLTIKHFDRGYSAADVLNEALNLAIVEESGFSVPAFQDVERIDGCWAIISRFVQGETLWERLQNHPEREDALIEQFVGIQMNMHSYTARRLRHHTDKMHSKISASGLDATTRYELHTRLNSLPHGNALLHGDFTPGNVIITPADEVCVIDWSHATQGNACGDAARTYLRFTLAGEERLAEKYVREYCRQSDTAYQQVQKWFAIVAASQLVKGNEKERGLLTRWTNVVEYE